MSELIAAAVDTDVTRALAEDVGSGDLTALLIPRRRPPTPASSPAKRR
jgi:nicotinate-nucleotide pyrophosphorylase